MVSDTCDTLALEIIHTNTQLYNVYTTVPVLQINIFLCFITGANIPLQMHRIYLIGVWIISLQLHVNFAAFINDNIW